MANGTVLSAAYVPSMAGPQGASDSTTEAHGPQVKRAEPKAASTSGAQLPLVAGMIGSVAGSMGAVKLLSSVSSFILGGGALKAAGMVATSLAGGALGDIAATAAVEQQKYGLKEAEADALMGVGMGAGMRLGELVAGDVAKAASVQGVAVGFAAGANLDKALGHSVQRPSADAPNDTASGAA